MQSRRDPPGVIARPRAPRGSRAGPGSASSPCAFLAARSPSAHADPVLLRSPGHAYRYAHSVGASRMFGRIPREMRVECGMWLLRLLLCGFRGIPNNSALHRLGSRVLPRMRLPVGFCGGGWNACDLALSVSRSAQQTQKGPARVRARVFFPIGSRTVAATSLSSVKRFRSRPLAPEMRYRHRRANVGMGTPSSRPRFLIGNPRKPMPNRRRQAGAPTRCSLPPPSNRRDMGRPARLPDTAPLGNAPHWRRFRLISGLARVPLCRRGIIACGPGLHMARSSIPPSRPGCHRPARSPAFTQAPPANQPDPDGTPGSLPFCRDLAVITMRNSAVQTAMAGRSDCGWRGLQVAPVSQLCANDRSRRSCPNVPAGSPISAVACLFGLVHFAWSRSLTLTPGRREVASRCTGTDDSRARSRRQPGDAGRFPRRPRSARSSCFTSGRTSASTNPVRIRKFCGHR